MPEGSSCAATTGASLRCFQAKGDRFRFSPRGHNPRIMSLPMSHTDPARPPLDWDLDEASAWGAHKAAHERACALVDTLLADGWARLDPREVNAAGPLVALHDTAVLSTTSGAQVATEAWAPAWWVELWRACPADHGNNTLKRLLQCAERCPEFREAARVAVRFAPPSPRAEDPHTTTARRILGVPATPPVMELLMGLWQAHRRTREHRVLCCTPRPERGPE